MFLGWARGCQNHQKRRKPCWNAPNWAINVQRCSSKGASVPGRSGHPGSAGRCAVPRVGHGVEGHAPGRGCGTPAGAAGRPLGSPEMGCRLPGGAKKVRIGLDKPGGGRKIVRSGGGPLRRAGAGFLRREAFGGSGAHNSGDLVGLRWSGNHEGPARLKRVASDLWRRVARFENATVPLGHVSVYQAR